MPKADCNKIYKQIAFKLPVTMSILYRYMWHASRSSTKIQQYEHNTNKYLLMLYCCYYNDVIIITVVFVVAVIKSYNTTLPPNQTKPCHASQPTSCHTSAKVIIVVISIATQYNSMDLWSFCVFFSSSPLNISNMIVLLLLLLNMT